MELTIKLYMDGGDHGVDHGVNNEVDHGVDHGVNRFNVS